MMRCIALIVSGAISQMGFWAVLIFLLITLPHISYIGLAVAAVALGISIGFLIWAWRQCRG